MHADHVNDDFMAFTEMTEADWAAFDPLQNAHQNPQTTSATPHRATGYVLWEYDGSAWVLKKDRCKPGAVPSAPPSTPGRFRGQLRAVVAVPAQAAVAD
jgi:hypothetical protein